MPRRSPIFDIGDIVRVPFPYVETDRTTARPALIVSRPLGSDASIYWAVMITAAQRGTWPGDVALLEDHLQYGLPVPCYIRTAKMNAFVVRQIERTSGRLSSELIEVVQGEIAHHLGLGGARPLNPAAAR
jgi:mRNA interferase MazF